jgi:hypothetical protein
MLYQTYLTATFEDSFLIEADSPEDASAMAEELFLDTTAIICEGDTHDFTDVNVFSVTEA